MYLAALKSQERRQPSSKWISQSLTIPLCKIQGRISSLKSNSSGTTLSFHFLIMALSLKLGNRTSIKTSKACTYWMVYEGWWWSSRHMRTELREIKINWINLNFKSAGIFLFDRSRVNRLESPYSWSKRSQSKKCTPFIIYFRLTLIKMWILVWSNLLWIGSSPLRFVSNLLRFSMGKSPIQ